MPCGAQAWMFNGSLARSRCHAAAPAALRGRPPRRPAAPACPQPPPGTRWATYMPAPWQTAPCPCPWHSSLSYCVGAEARSSKHGQPGASAAASSVRCEPSPWNRGIQLACRDRQVGKSGRRTADPTLQRFDSHSRSHVTGRSAMQPKDLQQSLSNTFAEAEEQAPPAAARAISVLRRALEPVMTTLVPVRLPS